MNKISIVIKMTDGDKELSELVDSINIEDREQANFALRDLRLRCVQAANAASEEWSKLRATGGKRS